MIRFLPAFLAACTGPSELPLVLTAATGGSGFSETADHRFWVARGDRVGIIVDGTGAVIDGDFGTMHPIRLSTDAAGGLAMVRDGAAFHLSGSGKRTDMVLPDPQPVLDVATGCDDTWFAATDRGAWRWTAAGTERFGPAVDGTRGLRRVDCDRVAVWAGGTAVVVEAGGAVRTVSVAGAITALDARNDALWIAHGDNRISVARAGQTPVEIGRSGGPVVDMAFGWGGLLAPENLYLLGPDSIEYIRP